MKKYWRELGDTYVAMSTPIQFTFTLMCFIPGLLLPLVWWQMKCVAASTTAEAYLLAAARSGTKIEDPAYYKLVVDLFSYVPSQVTLILAIVAVSFLGCAVYGLVRGAAYLAKRREKANNQVAIAATDS